MPRFGCPGSEAGSRAGATGPAGMDGTLVAFVLPRRGIVRSNSITENPPMDPLSRPIQHEAHHRLDGGSHPLHLLRRDLADDLVALPIHNLDDEVACPSTHLEY